MRCARLGALIALSLAVGVAVAPALAVQPPPVLKPPAILKPPLLLQPVKPEVALKTVPSVIGMSEAQARASLERAGFATGAISRVASDAAAGTVISQSVSPGKRHDPREPIALQLSLGSRPEINVFKPPVIDPDVFKGLVTPPARPEPPPESRPPTDDVQPRLIVVPELRRATLAQARARLQLRRLALGQIERRAADAPAGVVIDQSPAAGTQLRKPQAVNVVLSTGPDLVTVPDVVGRPLEVAREMLAPLTRAPIEEQWTASSRPRGMVLRQVPAAGTQVKRSPPPRFRLFVSRGPPRLVPHVVERPREVAERLIRAADLRVGVVREVPSDAPAGVVIDQKPKGGTDIVAERVVAVDLLVSRGSPAPEPIEVPNVVGDRESAARARIGEAGLSVGDVAREPAAQPPGIVIEQKPRGGTRVPRDARVRVDIVVSIGPAEPPAPRRMPNLVGEMLDAVPARVAPLELSLAGVRAQPSLEAKGVVVAQDPPAGAPVKPGAEVHVTVSDGSRVRVPALVGRDRDEAAQRLREADLLGRESTRETAERHGVVLEQRPAAGTEVARGSPVQVVVAAPAAPAPRVEVPDVVGAPITSARERIEAAGLVVATREADSLAYEAGTVAAQWPAGGTQVAPESAVQLTVSLGLPPLPDLVGLPAAQARGEVAQLGLSARISEELSDDRPDGVVLAQSPAAGARLSRGAEVALVVSLARSDGAAGIPPAVLVAGAAGGALVLAGAGALLARRLRAPRKPQQPGAKRAVIDSRVRLDATGRDTALETAPERQGPDLQLRVRLEHGESRVQREQGERP